MGGVHKFWTRVLLAVVAGLLIASAGTKITYPCKPTDLPVGESVSRCVSFEKAVMHPGDLLRNKHDSLEKYSVSFAVTSLVVFGVLSVLHTLRRNRAEQSAGQHQK